MIRKGNVRKTAAAGIFAVGLAWYSCFASYGAGGTNAAAGRGLVQSLREDAKEREGTDADWPLLQRIWEKAKEEGTDDGGSLLQQIWEKAKEQESAVTGEDPMLIPESRILAEDRAANDLRVISMAEQCIRGDGEDRAFYVIGRNYVPEGSILPVIFGRRLEYSCTPEEDVVWRGDTYSAVRFAVREVPGSWDGESGGAFGNREDGSGGSAGKPEDSFSGSVSGESLWDEKDVPALHHWEIGDVVARTLDGVKYRFRCIDPNYGEGRPGNDKSLALFLCESVIPANTGSRYVHERREDGSRSYVFHPGPVVNFGESSEYADSKIRQWLISQEADADRFPDVDVGVERSCTGETARRSFSRFDPSLFRFYRLGSQILTDRYFILSLEEALKYREHLWNIDGSGEEESAANAGAFNRGFWLRTPMGDGRGADAGSVYIVDLVNGTIHPQAVKPDAEGERDEELAVTSPVGVRPAFVLRQRG